MECCHVCRESSLGLFDNFILMYIRLGHTQFATDFASWNIRSQKTDSATQSVRDIAHQVS